MNEYNECPVCGGRKRSTSKLCIGCAGAINYDVSDYAHGHKSHVPPPAAEIARKEAEALAIEIAKLPVPMDAGRSLPGLDAPGLIVFIPIDHLRPLNKNNAWGYNRGRGFVRPQLRAAKELLIAIIERACLEHGVQFVDGRVTIEMLYHRPNMKSDPANFIDFILDAIKVAIGVDDRWYEVAVTWEVEATRPGLSLKIEQEPLVEPQRFCARCFQFFGESRFYRTDSYCRPCKLASTRDGKRRKRQKSTQGPPPADALLDARDG